LVIGEQVTIAHVGDSRAYMLHLDGRIELLTKDHSLVHKLVELGQITEEEALTHPNRNVLYRALGQPEAIERDFLSMQLSHSNYLILCSDGLWGAVPDSDIAEIVLSAANPSQACQTLVQAANENGGPDNISVIVMRYV
jgi:protein phosphatase